MAYNPPIGSIYHLYTTYILPSGGIYATYHLLGEPETTIDLRSSGSKLLTPIKLSCQFLQIYLNMTIFFRELRPMTELGGGFKHFLFSPLLGEDSHFDEHIFQKG